MKEIALKVGSYNINELSSLNESFKGKNVTLASFVSQALDLVFMIAGFLMFIWAVWGVFEYIFAGGNKDKLGKARGRITWAIVGFIFIALAFLVSQYIGQLLPVQDVKLKGGG